MFFYVSVAHYRLSHKHASLLKFTSSDCCHLCQLITAHRYEKGYWSGSFKSTSHEVSFPTWAPGSWEEGKDEGRNDWYCAAFFFQVSRTALLALCDLIVESCRYLFCKMAFLAKHVCFRKHLVMKCKVLRSYNLHCVQGKCQSFMLLIKLTTE